MLVRQFLVFILLNFIFQLPTFAEEKLFFQLDGREWDIGYKNINDDETIIELTLEDEEILNWTELFAIHSYKNLQDISVNDFLKSLQNTYKEEKLKAINEQIQFKWDSNDPTNLLESSFSNKDKEHILPRTEFNLARVIKGKDSFYYLQYSAKDQKVYEKNKDLWANHLKEAFIGEKIPENITKGHWFYVLNDDVFQGEKKLSYNPELAIITDYKAGFSVAIPSNWFVSQEWINQESDDKMNSGAIALLYRRPDQVVYGGVVFTNLNDIEAKENTSSISREVFFNEYKKQNPNAKILREGDIETASLDQGKYVVFEDGDEIGWFTFFANNQRIYRLEIWCPKNQFEVSGNDFEILLTGFHVL